MYNQPEEMSAMTFSIEFNGNGLAIDRGVNFKVGAQVTTSEGVFFLTTMTVRSSAHHLRSMMERHFAIPLDKLPDSIQRWVRQLLTVIYEIQRAQADDEVESAETRTVPLDYRVPVVGTSFGRGGSILRKGDPLRIIMMRGTPLGEYRSLGVIDKFELID
ncbi:MAG: hypothetical protein ABIQ04_01380 [Candidatus Saccharimonadales bacterium]